MWPGHWGNFNIVFVIWALFIIALLWILYRYWRAKRQRKKWQDPNQDRE